MEKLFGRSYESVGNSSSDLILKCRGQVKVKWGNKYIDLVKDGKVASNGLTIKRVSSDSIPTAAGIYTTEDGSIYVSDGTQAYNIYGEAGTNYVSFIGEQKVTGEQQLQAQLNIGIVHNSVDSLNESTQTDGIFYVVEEGAIYLKQNGQITQLNSSMPNPITDTLNFEVSGVAISIANGGSIQIGDVTISQNSIVTNSDFNIQRGNNQIRLVSNGIIINNLQTNNAIITKLSSTNNIDEDNPSQCYSIDKDDNGYYILTIDKIRTSGIEPIEYTFLDFMSLMESESLTPNTSYVITDFQNEWELREDPILEDVQSTDENGNPIYVVIETGEQISDPDVVNSYDSDELQPVIEEYKTVHPLIVTAVATNQISSTAIMIDNPQWTVQYDPTYQDIVKSYPATVGENDDSEYYNSETGNIELTAKGRITKLTDEFNNTCNYDFKHLRYWYNNSWHYTFDNNGVDASLTGDVKNCTIIDQNYQISGELPTGQYDDEGNEITSRIIIRDGCQIVLSGNISDITANNLTNCTLYGEINNSTFHGNISNQTITSTELLANPNKVKDIYYDGGLQILCIPDLLSPPMPTGAIISYNGTDIPDGWALCDGSNGTPDLRDKFIVGGDSVGEGAELLSTATSDESYTLSYYKLIFIIKL